MYTYEYFGLGQCVDASGVVPSYAWKHEAFSNADLLQSCTLLCNSFGADCIGVHIQPGSRTCGYYGAFFGSEYESHAPFYLTPAYGAVTAGFVGHEESEDSSTAGNVIVGANGASVAKMCYGRQIWATAVLDEYVTIHRSMVQSLDKLSMHPAGIFPHPFYVYTWWSIFIPPEV